MEVSDLGVVDELRLHGRLVFDMRFLINSLREVLGGRGEASLAVGLAEHVLALHSLDVSSISGDVLSRFDSLLQI